MAKFKIDRNERRCDLCGRKSTAHVRIKYAKDPSQPRSVATRQLFICKDCGHLVFAIIEMGESNKDRTVRYEKDIP